MYNTLRQLLTLGWRNIFRNTRRTVITAIVIGIGLATLIFMDAYLVGMKNNMISRVTKTFLGEAQVHRKGFRLTRNVEDTIQHAQTLDDFLTAAPVAAFTARVISPCMLTSSRNVSSVTLYGIAPDTERTVSTIDRAITAGSFLGTDQFSILLGYDVAELLEVSIGDHIIATVAQAHSGDLMQELFTVVGIFNVGDPLLDKSTAFIPRSTAQKMLLIGDGIHEIAMQFNGSIPNEHFFATASSFGNEALDWRALTPSLDSLLRLIDYTTLITEVILFVLVIFTIMNTLFMSLFERMTEFGLLKAVGTRPHHLFFLIIIESASLAVISIIVGIAIGIAVIAITTITGINYAGIDIAGITFAEPIYPVIRIQQLTLFPLAILSFTVIAALYPAYSAARIIPVKALQDIR